MARSSHASGQCCSASKIRPAPSSSARVDLLLGSIDLHRRAHLAYLGQRLGGREMAPMGPVYALLVELALRDSQPGHVLGLECFEIVSLPKHLGQRLINVIQPVLQLWPSLPICRSVHDSRVISDLFKIHWRFIAICFNPVR